MLHTQSFVASLNPDNSSETFNLSTTVTNPESLTFTVTSAYGNDGRAEFSEIRFNGSIAAVPEPNAVGLLALSMAGWWFGQRRRRK